MTTDTAKETTDTAKKTTDTATKDNEIAGRQSRWFLWCYERLFLKLNDIAACNSALFSVYNPLLNRCSSGNVDDLL